MTAAHGAPSIRRHGLAEGVPMAPDQIDNLVETAAWDAGTEVGFELARTKANQNLTDALVRTGWSVGGAQALARACVRPDDVRRRLSAPVELRVPGGTMLVVESRVLSHGVTATDDGCQYSGFLASRRWVSLAQRRNQWGREGRPGVQETIPTDRVLGKDPSKQQKI